MQGQILDEMFGISTGLCNMLNVKLNEVFDRGPWEHTLNIELPL